MKLVSVCTSISFFLLACVIAMCIIYLWAILTIVLLMQVGYTPDYLFLLQTILRTDPQVCKKILVGLFSLISCSVYY